MINNNSYRQKGRATFLAAIMVLSMVATSAALAAPAAAQSDATRTVGTTSPAPGDTVSVTTTFTIDDGNSNFGITEEFSPAFSSVSLGPTNLNNNFFGNAITVSDSTFASYNFEAGDISTGDTVEVTYDVTIPQGATDGQQFEISANGTSGAGTDTLTVDAGSNNNQGSITVSVKDSQGNALVGEDVELTNESSDSQEAVATTDSNGEVTFTGLKLDVSYTASVPGNNQVGEATTTPTSSAQDRTIQLGGTESGAITAVVTDTDGFPVEDANVTLYTGASAQGNVLKVGIADGGPDNNRIRFEDLSVNQQYTVQASSQDGNFEADDRSATLNLNNNEETLFPELKNNLDAQAIEIVRWDTEDNEPITTNTTGLLANGQEDNSQTLAVLTQNQQDESIIGSLDVDLDVLGPAENLDGNDQVSVGDFNDTDDAIDKDIEVTIDGEDEVELDDDYAGLDQGTVSFETFEITADDASRQKLSNNDLDPIASQPISATAQNESTTLSDDGTVNYFVEGDKSTQHQVVNRFGEPVENANVWVAYEGASQKLTDVETVQNEEGNAFLTAETNSDGIAVIDGIIGAEGSPAEPSFNVYVEQSGFNLYNSSVATVSGGGTLASATAVPSDYFVADYNIDNTIVGDEGSGEDDVYSHVLRSTPRAFDLDVTAEDTDGDFKKLASVSAGSSTQVRVDVDVGEVGQDTDEFTPYNGTVVLETLSPTSTGNLVGAGADDELVVDVTNGEGTATFTTEPTDTGQTNISAFKINSENNEYRTNTNVGVGTNEDGGQANIDVFAASNIEGTIVNDDNEVVPGATVTLFRETSPNSGTFNEIDEKVTTNAGSFSFTDIPSGPDYKVESNITIDGQEFTGFNEGQLEQLAPGSTGIGITLTGLTEVPDQGGFPAAYTDSNGVVQDGGLTTATTDYLSGDLTDSQITAVTSSYLSEEPIENYL